MRIVVFGGAGFIGSAVCRMLVADRGATVLNIDKLTAASSLASLGPIAQSPRYSFRRTDICDSERVAALLTAFAPDAIVHAAVEKQGGTRSTGIPAALEINALCTWRLLEATREYWSSLSAARQAKFRFLSVSSADALGSAADDLVTAWHKSYGLPTLVSKAAPTFGPYQFPGSPVAAAALSAIDGNPALEAGAEPSDWIFIEDHVRALLAMLDKGTPGATYTVAGRGRITPEALIGRVAQLVERHGTRPVQKSLAVKPAKPVEVQAAGPAVISSARLEQDTGWRAEETLETALSKTARWYLANEAWWRPLAAAPSASHDFGLLRIA